jgi:hypothetical protein
MEAEPVRVQLHPVDVAAVAGPIAGLVDQAEQHALVFGPKQPHGDVAVDLAGQRGDKRVEFARQRSPIRDSYDDRPLMPAVVVEKVDVRVVVSRRGKEKATVIAADPVGAVARFICDRDTVGDGHPANVSEKR